MCWALELLRFRQVCWLMFLGAMANIALISLVASTNAQTPTKKEIAKAESEFRTYCSACHGIDARGHGPVAKELKTPPPDLTNLASRAGGNFPTEAVFQKIDGWNMPTAHGTSDMPVWGERFVLEELGSGVLLEDARKATNATLRRISRLVKYLETIQD